MLNRKGGVAHLLENSRLEGESGVKNLARIANALGYRDSTYFGQFDHDGCYGDLIEFLEDNPGACEAIANFIQENFEGDINDDAS